jgi:hypothetical protein
MIFSENRYPLFGIMLYLHCSSAQLRWHCCCWVEQFAAHRLGSVVTPTVVIDGMTVVTLIVAMQVF